MKVKALKKKIFNNKILAAILILLMVTTLGIGGLILNIFSGSLSDSTSLESYDGGPTELQADSAADSFDLDQGQDSVEVQESDIEIETDNVEQDRSDISSLSENFDGYVEESSQRQTDLYRTVKMEIRVPEDSFEQFVDQIREDYDVEEYETNNYRVSIERETDELDTLDRTLNEYKSIRQEIEDVEDEERRLELLMQVTEKELEIQEMMNRYERQLSDAQDRSEMATVSIRLQEDRDPEIMPQDVGDRFSSELGDSLDTVTEITIRTFTGSIEILFRGFQYLVYALVLAVPGYVGYRIGRRGYRNL